MISKDDAKQRIAQLVERFSEQAEFYHRVDYKEAQLRVDFVNPFFKALGWDVDNEAGHAEAYREVIYEDKLTMKEGVKAPDYAFRLAGGKRLFFVEAKKPSVLVKEDVNPAYQVRRYGWSAKLPVSIVTDFAEFAVYDCTKKPSLGDKASVARTKYITYNDYVSEFDFLWDTFSREKVLKGSFDKYIQSTQHKRGTATVDKAFLDSLDAWRTLLAQDIARNNKQLSEDELNFAVQQTIDRIIFLRIAEDRGVEPYGRLKNVLLNKNHYGHLFEAFKEADAKYNSGLFDFKKDRISKDLTIDDKTLKTIVTDLYYPQSPYEFSVLSVEILGSAYEQFLGKVIRLDAAHRAKIEEKPEVRKAGGVYYTPQYIVDYIVQHTVGKLVEGKTPKDIAALRIVDPACGSGSFLLGAYQFLLDWHKAYYTEKANAQMSPAGGGVERTFDGGGLASTKALTSKSTSVSAKRGDTSPSTGSGQAAGGGHKHKKDSPLRPDGELTTAEKKRILTQHIYGVDLDYNAVEVTKLSLLLKCMEKETAESISVQTKLFNERILPTLDANIQAGNSLVDTDYYDSQLFDDEDRKVKPFNWQKAFPEVFRQGGFDAVIGNPPYVRQELLGDAKQYFERKYKVYHGMADLYSYFIERGMSLLNDNGIFGIIVANKWMRANYGEPLRKFLKQQRLLQLVDFGDLPVFQGATTYPMIVIATKPTKKENATSTKLSAGLVDVVDVKTLDFESLDKYVSQRKQHLDKSNLDDNGWQLGGELEQQLLRKISKAGIPLGEYVDGKIYRGVLTGLSEAFVIDSATKRRLIKEDKRSSEVIKPFLAGRDIKRYETPESDKHLIIIPKGFTNERAGSKSPAKWFRDNYPAVANHLEQFKQKAEERYDKGDYYWELRACDYYDQFGKPKIIYQVFQVKPCFIWDEKGFYCNNSIWIIPTKDKALIAILNSPLGWFLISKYCTQIQNGYQLIYKYFEKIPIKVTNPKDKTEKSIHDEIVANVEALLKLNEALKDAKLQTRIDQLKQRIEHHEQKVNALVYKLYNLTPHEIALVEAG